MTPARRESTAGRAYLDLQALARRTGRPTQELLVLYVLERFLFRLARSAYRDRLVLKGGMLLACLDSRRPTADIDLLAQAVANDVDTIAGVVTAVLAISVDDGVVYEPDRLDAQVIRDAELYASAAARPADGWNEAGARQSPAGENGGVGSSGRPGPARRSTLAE